jgi:hypothetical protein
MSIWTSKAAVACTALAMALAGCGDGRFADVGAAISRGAPARDRIAVADNAVVIAGPSGFCVDPRSTKAAGPAPFVMMGNCASISGNSGAAQPQVQAVLTATVIPMVAAETFDGTAAQLQAFFMSEEGRRALSRSGNPETVAVQEMFAEGDTFYLRANDTSPGPANNLAAEHWRAYFNVNDRLVSATVLGFQGRQMTPEQGLSVVRDFADRIRDASPAAGQVPAAAITVPVASPVPVPQATPARAPWRGDGLGNVGIFRRLLG